jgi:hypothetical protein
MEEKPKKEAPDEEILSRLYHAAKMYDIESIDKIMEELERYEYSGDPGLVRWLKGHIEISDFDSLCERLQCHSE